MKSMMWYFKIVDALPMQKLIWVNSDLLDVIAARSA